MADVFLVRPFPNEINRMEAFRKESIIGLGWNELGDLKNNDIDKIREIIKKHVDSGTDVRSPLSNYNTFVNKIKIGDYIVSPEGATINIGIIKGDYFFDVDNDQEYGHQRNIEWIKKCLRDELTDELRGSLRVQRTVANLSKHKNAIESLIKDEKPQKLKDTEIYDSDIWITTIYQLRPDLKIEIKVPKDISQQEAARLGDYVTTLFWEK